MPSWPRAKTIRCGPCPCRRTAGDAPGLGTEYTFTVDGGLFKIRGRLQVVNFKPPTAIARGLESWVMRTWPRYTFTAVDEGTHLRTHVDIEHRLLFRPFESIQKTEAAKTDQQQLHNVKAHLEGESA